MVLLNEYILFSATLPPNKTIQWNTTLPSFYPNSTDLVDAEISYVAKSLSFGEITNVTTANYAITNPESSRIYYGNTTSNNVIVTLPTAVSYPFMSLHFRKTSSNNSYTIAASPGELIDGNSSIIFTAIDSVCTISSNGSNSWSTDVTLVSNVDTSIEDPDAAIASTINHNLLANLQSGDAHPQYVLGAGRVGGQVIFGSPSAGENLFLQGNSNNSLGSIVVNNTTQSINSTTGALVLYGGLGIGGNINNSGTISNGAIRISSSTISTLSGNLILDANSAVIETVAQLNCTSGIASTSVNTGAITVVGGIGISGRVTANNSVIGNITSSLQTIGTVSGNLILRPASGNNVQITAGIASTSINTGDLVVAGGMGIAGMINGVSAQFGNININGVTNFITSAASLSFSATNVLLFTSNCKITDSTASTSITTGALTIAGGLGVTGAIYASSIVNGNVTITTNGVANTTSPLQLSGINSVTITNTTVSTSTSTGALTVAGGVGVTGRISTDTLYAGTININGTNADTITCTNTLVLSGQIAVSTPSIFQITNATASTLATNGALVVAGGVGITGAVNTLSNINLAGTISNTAASFVINGGSTAATACTINASGTAATAGILTLRGNPTTATGTVSVICNTASTSTTTGGLIVAGGIGAVGRVTAANFVAGTILANVTANSITNTAAMTISSTLALNLSSGGATNLTLTAGTTGTVQIAAASRVVVNNVTAAAPGGVTSALSVVGGINTQNNLIVGSTTVYVTVSSLGVTSNTSLLLSSTGANGITITSGNNIITAGTLSFNTSTATSVTGNNLTINATANVTGGVLSLRGNGTDNTGTVAILCATVAGVGAGALVVSGGTSIGERIFVGNNLIVASDGISSNGALTIASATNQNIILNSTGNSVVSSAIPIVINNNNPSTSANTGALIVSGGIGCAGNSTFSGIFTVANNTAGAIGTGALVVSGGVSIGEALYVSQIATSTIASNANLTVSSGNNSNLILASPGTGIITSSSIVSFTNNTPSISASTGALLVSGGIGCAGNSTFSGIFTVANISSATSATTGCAIFSGGIGIAENVFAGGKITANNCAINGGIASTSISTGTIIVTGGIGASGNLFVGGTGNFAGILSVSNNTASTAPTNGALIIAGGIGCAGNSNFSGVVTFAGSTLVTNTVDSSNINTGSLIISGGVGIAKKMFIGDILTSVSTNVSTSSTTGAVRLSGGMGVLGNIYAAGIIATESTTNSTGTTNGALIVSGGVGIAGNNFTGGLLRVVNTTQATSNTTGCAVFSGGIGVNNDIYLGGNVVLAPLSTVDGVDVSVLDSRVALLESYPKGFGNVIRVDLILGNNTTGARNGLPFATIAAAIAVAVSGDVIFIYPGVYTITAAIALPSGVSLVGILRESTIISYTTTASATLLTIAANCNIANVTMRLISSTANVSLTGIDLTGTAAVTSTIMNVSLAIDNSAGSGTGNITGINSAGTGTTTKNYAYTLRNSIIDCSSNGAGTKRAVIISGANHIYAKNCEFAMTRIGGAGSYIATETNNASAILQLESCHCAGSDADISQTAGVIRLANTVLSNATSNALNFAILNYGNTLIFSDPGTIGSDALRYFYPCENVTGNPINYRIFKPLIIKNLIISARVAPGTGNTSTITVYKNGVATGLTATLNGTASTGENTTIAVSYAINDTYAVTHTGTGGSNLADVIVQLEVY